tara:strand:+ start:1293 stop:2312 length:1020 start_codon:yes stop_codon:yes gene_type:complete
MLKELSKIADALDERSLVLEADFLDRIISLASERDGDSLPVLNDEEEFNPFSHLDEFDEEEAEIDVEKDCVLTFGTANSKLSYLGTTSFSLPAGYTCPYARICKSKVPREGKKITDYGDIRCFQSTIELARPSVRKSRWKNFDLVRSKSAGEITDLILKSLKYHESKVRAIKVLRVHDSGDFFNQNYFDGWLEAIRMRPDIVFYAYTKAIPLWKARKDKIPPNFKLIASEGGTNDDDIEETFRRAVIVSGVDEAIEKQLGVDVNEFLAIFGEGDFALLLHGTQPKGQLIDGRKATNVAKENKSIIVDMAKKHKVPYHVMENLIGKITDAAKRELRRSSE